jgi:hypothetical protein
MAVKYLIDKVLITLEVAETTALLIALTKDGQIHRKGNGNVANTALQLAQGFSSDGHFEALMMTVDESIFHYAGIINEPEKAGKECRLTIVFQGGNGLDYSFRVLYGEDSQGPPAELVKILVNAVAITEPWYQQQLNPEPQKKWWQFWK